MKDPITFSIQTETVKYGDRRAFVEYRILMHDYRGLVGFEEGPRRSSTTRSQALKVARARLRVLKTHRLFAIRVTKKHIEDGEARNCHTCAISQALWHNQDRMGLPKSEWTFEVKPYAAFVDADGLVLRRKWEGEGELLLPPHEMPDLVLGQHGKRVLNESMVEWAMDFDDWGDSRFMSLADWREVRGYKDGERPYPPSPGCFVLDLDAMKPPEAEEEY